LTFQDEAEGARRASAILSLQADYCSYITLRGAVGRTTPLDCDPAAGERHHHGAAGMSGAGIVDSKTFTIWRNAFIEVLRSKRRERGQLIGLLRRRDVVRLMTSDAAEFIAWLLEPRDKRGVRPLPRTFKFYQEIANDLTP
jgi:hypothetical protein